MAMVVGCLTLYITLARFSTCSVRLSLPRRHSTSETLSASWCVSAAVKIFAQASMEQYLRLEIAEMERCFSQRMQQAPAGWMSSKRRSSRWKEASASTGAATAQRLRRGCRLVFVIGRVVISRKVRLKNRFATTMAVGIKVRHGCDGANLGTASLSLRLTSPSGFRVCDQGQLTSAISRVAFACPFNLNIPC